MAQTQEVRTVIRMRSFPNIRKPWIIVIILLIVGCTAIQEEPVPVVETPPEKVIISTGNFYKPSAQGTVSIILENDSYKLSISNLQSRLTPDLRLFLITAAGERIDIYKFEEEPIGDFKFDLPMDLTNIVAVDLYCVYCEASFGEAKLE